MPFYCSFVLKLPDTCIYVCSPQVFDNADDLKKIKELGHGSYSSVYKMIHEPTGYIMAVKVGVT